MSSLLHRLPSRTGLLAVAFLVALVYLGHATATNGLVGSIRCVHDAQAMIAAVEAGATSYDGVCGSFGAPEPLVVVPPDMWERLDRYRSEEQTLSVPWIGTEASRTVAAVAGGFPLTAAALILGVGIAAGEVKGGTAAWLLSNGWTRRRYLAEKAVALVTAVGLLYVVALVFEIALAVHDLGGALHIAPLGPGLVAAGAVSLLAACLYGAAAMAVGFLIGHPDSALALTALATVADLLTLAHRGGPLYSPAAAVAAALRLGHPDLPASWATPPPHLTTPVAIVWCLTWTLLSAAAVYAVVVRRRFQARPARTS